MKRCVDVMGWRMRVMYRRYRRGSDLEDTDKLDWVIGTTRVGGKDDEATTGNGKEKH